MSNTKDRSTERLRPRFRCASGRDSEIGFVVATAQIGYWLIVALRKSGNHLRVRVCDHHQHQAIVSVTLARFADEERTVVGQVDGDVADISLFESFDHCAPSFSGAPPATSVDLLIRFQCADR